jgi:GT2 family glycosyltransferase
VVILNWNGWSDTLGCLESVLQLAYDNLCIVVCDNGSTDGSVPRILEWVEARLPFCRRAARFTSLTATDAAAARGIESATGQADAVNLVLIQIQANLGFAGGNNVGLRFALARGDLDYAWLLNNDTVVAPDSLTHLVARIRETPDAGICGSTLLHFDEPRTVQARGARYNKWLSRVRHVSSPSDPNAEIDEDEYARTIQFVVGASILVSRNFLEDVGLINERYFLYFEELDWTLRAAGRYRFAYSSRSLVYHRGGAATGASTAKKSSTGEYYGTRGRILFTRSFYFYALPTVLLAIGISALVQFLRGHGALAKVVLTAAADGLRGRTGPRSTG